MLLEEVRVTEIKLINENSSDGLTRFTCIAQRADEKNQNGRVYPRKVLAREVERMQPLCESNQLIGELDHPSDAIVKLKNASHLITKLYWKGSDVICEGLLLPTPAGQIAESLLRAKVKLGISSRGTGSLTEGIEGKIVNEDYNMITFDLVVDPSTKGAFPTIMESNQRAVEFANEYIKPVIGEKLFITMLESTLKELKSAPEYKTFKVLLEEKTPKKEPNPAQKKHKLIKRYVKTAVGQSPNIPTKEALKSSKEKSRLKRARIQSAQKQAATKHNEMKKSIGAEGGDVGEYTKIYQQKRREAKDAKKAKSTPKPFKTTTKPKKLNPKHNLSPEEVNKIRTPKKTIKIGDKKYDEYKIRHAAREMRNKKYLDRQHKNPRNSDPYDGFKSI